MQKWLCVAILALMCFAGLPVLAQQDSSSRQGEWFCPGGRGFGRMANVSRNQCPRGFGPMGIRACSNEPLTREQAARLLENYVFRSGNPNLKAGDVVEKDAVFEATVVTKDGSLVEQLEIDKNTGLFRRIS